MSPPLKQNTHNHDDIKHSRWNSFVLRFTSSTKLTWELFTRLGEKYKEYDNDSQQRRYDARIKNGTEFPKRKWLFCMHPWRKQHKQKVFRPKTIRQFRVSLMLLWCYAHQANIWTRVHHTNSSYGNAMRLRRCFFFSIHCVSNKSNCCIINNINHLRVLVALGALESPTYTLWSVKVFNAYQRATFGRANLESTTRTSLAYLNSFRHTRYPRNRFHYLC